MKQHQLQHGYFNRVEANDDFISFVNFFHFIHCQHSLQCKHDVEKGIKKFCASLITLVGNLTFPRQSHGRNKYNGTEIKADRSALGWSGKKIIRAC